MGRCLVDGPGWTVSGSGGVSGSVDHAVERSAAARFRVCPGPSLSRCSACQNSWCCSQGSTAAMRPRTGARRCSAVTWRYRWPESWPRHAAMVASARIAAQAISSDGLSTVAETSPTMSSSQLMRSKMASSRASLDGYMGGRSFSVETEGGLGARLTHQAGLPAPMRVQRRSQGDQPWSAVTGCAVEVRALITQAPRRPTGRNAADGRLDLPGAK